MPLKHTINATLKSLSIIRMLENLPVFLVLSCVILCLTSCVTRQEIRAYFWLHNGIPDEICRREPSLFNYGFYRKLNSGQFEFMSFCKPESRQFLGLHERDLEEILNKTLPEN